MDLATTAAALHRLGAEMKPDLPAAHAALPAVRRLMADAGVTHRLVGGLAVIHHGYERLATYIDVLLPSDATERLAPWFNLHGFERVSPNRLRHLATGVLVDTLTAGTVLRGPGPAPPLPSPDAVAVSPADAEVVALEVLINLKLDAGRSQDRADVVALLKRLDEGGYVHLEASVRPTHRAELWRLREDALEELHWARENGAT